MSQPRGRPGGPGLGSFSPAPRRIGRRGPAAAPGALEVRGKSEQLPRQPARRGPTAARSRPAWPRPLRPIPGPACRGALGQRHPPLLHAPPANSAQVSAPAKWAPFYLQGVRLPAAAARGRGRILRRRRGCRSLPGRALRGKSRGAPSPEPPSELPFAPPPGAVCGPGRGRAGGGAGAGRPARRGAEPSRASGSLRSPGPEGAEGLPGPAFPEAGRGRRALSVPTALRIFIQSLC